LEDDVAEHHWRLHQESRRGVVAMCRDVFPDTPYARAYGVDAEPRIRDREYGWEDIDWGYRLHRLGVPIVIPEGFTTLHHGPVTSTVEKASRAFSTGSARRRFLARHGPDVLGGLRTERSVWNGLVAAASYAATERTIPKVAAIADRAIGRVPPWVGEKTVALLVQAAARAGERAG
jgi:hypothetical protein